MSAASATAVLIAMLADAREEAGVRQADLAVWIGKCRTTVRDWEAGRSSPPLRDYVAAADHLGYDVLLVPRDGDAAPVRGRRWRIRWRPGCSPSDPASPLQQQLDEG